MDWPKLQNTRVGADDRSPAGYPTNWYNTVTGGSANVKGSYVEMVAAAAFDVSGILLTVNIGSSGNSYLLDIATGAAASEQNIVPNFPVQSFRVGGNLDVAIYIPVKIVKGSRIALRVQSTGGAVSLQCSMNLLGDGFAGIQPPSQWTAFGADTGNSSGTSTATSGSPSFVQLTASTSVSFRWAYLFMLNGGSDDYEWGFAIGTTLVFSNIRNSGQGYGMVGPFPWYVPGGSQLQSKVKSVNSTTVRTMIMGGT
jgi:hypothetical protein